MRCAFAEAAINNKRKGKTMRAIDRKLSAFFSSDPVPDPIDLHDHRVRRALSPADLPLHVAEQLDPEIFLELSAPVLDVRSPAEFSRGHIPGAHSFPLFSDEERAIIGTLYKHEGRDRAFLKGLEFTGPRMAQMVCKALDLAPERKVRLHCWRGGERSASVGWLFSKAGFQVSILKGGYKAFRNHVLQYFDRSLDLRVLGGFTGSGKTAHLRDLRSKGHQVIDLEDLACHKGSSFGAIGQLPQPSTEHFENLLFNELRKIDPMKPLWLEDESMMIGKVRIPDGIYHQMRSAPLIFIDRPLEERAAHLVEEYGRHDAAELAAAIGRIGKRLGPQHAKAALEALDQGDLYSVAIIALRYYDKAYSRGLAERDPSQILRLVGDGTVLQHAIQQHAAING